ncbi:MAG: hypothetical protein AAF141_07390 [Pseudomonadota bacterium]
MAERVYCKEMPHGKFLSACPAFAFPVSGHPEANRRSGWQFAPNKPALRFNRLANLGLSNQQRVAVHRPKRPRKDQADVCLHYKL